MLLCEWHMTRCAGVMHTYCLIIWATFDMFHLRRCR